MTPGPERLVFAKGSFSSPPKSTLNDPTGGTSRGVWTDPTDGYPKAMLIMAWRKHLPMARTRSRRSILLPKY